MSTIKCRTCNTAMIVDRCESSHRATTCWHQCPLCKQVRLTSEREPGAASTNGEEDVAYNPESEFTHAH